MLPEYVKFYYSRFSEAKKDVYMQLYKGLREHKKCIDIQTDPSVIQMEDLMYIFTCLYNDTPSFYFVDLSKISYIQHPNGYTFFQEFIYSEEKIEEFDKKIIDGLKVFKARYIKNEMTDYEKEIVIHNYLVRTITYDSQSISNEEERNRHGEIYNILGALLRKKAVCWGIACAFKLICDYCKIKCFVVLGNALPIREGEPGHAWNIVRIDDENYHVDVTWDIKGKNDISCIYDYLNLNDALIKLDHTWQDDIYPPCKSLVYNYYHRNKLYVRTLEQIPGYVKTRLLSGERYITFKFVNKMPAQEKIKDQIQRGILQSGLYRSWILVTDINVDTHNVYIEIKT